MKKVGVVVLFSVLGLLTVFGISRCDRKQDFREDTMIAHIKKFDDLVVFFPKSAAEIEEKTKLYSEQIKKQIADIIAVPDEQRTWENTGQALDYVAALANVEMLGSACAVLKEVSPDADIREAASKALMEIASLNIDLISNNVQLYRAFKAYAEGSAKKENLAADQQYFIDETMADFKRAGLDLPEDQLEAVKKIKKEIVDLSLQFDTNISADDSHIVVDRAALAGLDDDFIASLEKSDGGKIIVGTDAPTYMNVMQNCTVEQTRRDLEHAYQNKAYPANETILQQIIAKRDKLAKMLGYKSYAHLNLDDEMMKTPERLEEFLQNLLVKLDKKEQKEFELLAQNLPGSVTLTQDGKLKPWDIRFVQNQYKKHNLAVDENKISEYFVLEDTLKGMFDIYEKFFNLRFEIENTSQFWYPELKLAKIYDKKTNELLAYLLLDLHPRPNKFQHAACFGVLSGTQLKGKNIPAISFVVANFPKSTATKPSLLKRRQVETLFHEFGHALHSILGRTRIASLSGTHTKTDFLELPSQLLEEWMWDPAILKSMSKHYQTGEPLPDELIEKIIALKQFDTGYFWQRQGYYAKVSLDYYKPGENKNLYEIMQRLYREIIKNSFADPDSHFYAHFGHLTGYGARYYSYIWSQVLTMDVFEEIKKHGLLNPEIGKKYRETILAFGGSKDPNELLKAFLGREPNDEAFIRSLGLN